MRRRALAPVLWLAFEAVAALAGARRALAASEPPPAGAQPSVPQPGPGSAAHPDRSGVELLASVGWGASTNDVLRLELSPYGSSFGLDAGYVWRSGFRLGGYFGYSLGRAVVQNYDPLVGNSFELTADTSSLNTGLSVGYDVPIYGFVLRYSLGLGATVMSWDFAPRSPNVARYSDNPLVGFHVLPGATLFWRHDWFAGGVGFRYVVQADGAIPSGFLGELLVGVHL